MSIKKTKAIILQNTEIAQETRRVILRMSDDFYRFTPGQFINIFFEEKLFRAYSIASSPSTLPELELCIKLIPDGQGSAYVERLSSGDEVLCMGPFGHFGRKDIAKRCVLVATGTGIAPMKSIVEAWQESGGSTPLTLMYGVRHESYVTYNDFFETCQKQCPLFSYHLCVSRPKGEGGWSNGRVTDLIRGEPSVFFADSEALLCGSSEMVKEVSQILQDEKGVAKEMICTEMY